MLRRAVLAFVPALLLAAPAKAADPELPAVDAERMIEPLRPDQLDAAERETYARLAPGSADARQFLYTRGFLRYARLVVDGKLPSAQLPRLPARDNWKRSFLSPDEATGVVDVAIAMRLAPTVAGMAPRTPVTVSSPNLPGVDADGRSLPLRLDQLDASERASYARLDPASVEARQFLYTRGFLRYARLVTEEKMSPRSLPKLPARADWGRKFLSETEAKEIVDLALAMSLSERMPPVQ